MKGLWLINGIFFGILVSGCGDKEIIFDSKEPVKIQIPDYMPNRTEVRSAIVAASHSLGWRAIDRAPGLIHLIHKIRGRESLTLEVDYSETQYVINYKDSSREAYNAASGEVHPYFESFAKELRIAIDRQLPKLSAPQPHIVVKPSVSIDFTNTAILEKEERQAAREKVEKEKEESEATQARLERIVENDKSDEAAELLGKQEGKPKEGDTPKIQSTSTQESEELEQNKAIEIENENNNETVDRPKADESKADESKADESKAEKPKVDKPKAERPKEEKAQEPQDKPAGDSTHEPVKTQEKSPEKQDSEASSGAVSTQDEASNK